MANICDKIANFQKAHNYFAKAKTVYSSLNIIIKAAKIDPKDVRAFQELMGITDAETRKLMKTLDRRARDAEAIAKAAFPDVPCYTLAAWMNWSKAIDKFGKESAQAQRGRELYLKALNEYDKALHERTSYCDLVIKMSQKQVQLYKGLIDVHTEAEKMCRLVIMAPVVTSTAPQAAAMKILLKFQGIPGRARRIYKAHEKVIKLAQIEKRRQQAARDENQIWIDSIRKERFNRLIASALKAFGVEV